MSDFEIENGVLVRYTGGGGDVRIPDGVTQISESAFRGRRDLTRVTIPYGVKRIDTFAFDGCSGLRALALPDSVEEMGGFVFDGCKSIACLRISANLKKLGSCTFRWCDALETAEIPDGVEELGYGVFKECRALKTVSIADSVRSIGEDAFRCCAALTEVKLGAGVETLGDGAFAMCTALPALTLPESLTAIGIKAFECCRSLRELLLPDAVRSVGYKAFGGSGIVSPPFVWEDASAEGAYAQIRICEATAVEPALLTRSAVWWSNAFGTDLLGIRDLCYHLALKYPAAAALRDPSLGDLINDYWYPKNAYQRRAFAKLLRLLPEPTARPLIERWLEKARQGNDAQLSADLLQALHELRSKNGDRYRKENDWMDLKTVIARDLLKIKAVFFRPEEPFTWASGIKSPVYCDNRLTLSDPEVRTDVETGLKTLIEMNYPDVQILMGTSTAGIAHAAITAQLMGLPMGYVRGGAKDHGRKNQIEGRLEPGQKVVVVEDLISTGGSVLEVVDVLRQAGAEVLGIASIFTYGMKKGLDRLREADVKNVSLTDFDRVAEIAAEDGYIAPADVQRLIRFRNDPADERWIDAGGSPCEA